MTFDLAFVLLVAAVITGCIWAADALFLRPRRAALAGAQSVEREPLLVEYSRSFFPVIVIVLLVRSFLFEPFRIPSSSMMPTLLVGDFIFVNKYVYGLRLPVINKEIVELGKPERGDVVVFRLPTDPGTNFIKRVVGLPGDTLTYRNKRLVINGEEMEVDVLGPYAGRGQPGARVAREQIGSVEHELLLIPGHSGREGEWTVPDGHYFLMGDNRDNSRDSRFQEVSMIPESKLVGKAVRIWMSWDRSRELWRRIVWQRIGDPII